MRRYWLLIVAVAGLLALAGCGSTMADLGEAQTVSYSGGGELTVRPTAAQVVAEGAKSYLVVTYDLDNPGNELEDDPDVTFSVFRDAALVDASGSTYRVSALQRTKRDEPENVSLHAGEGIGDLLYFDAPAGADVSRDFVWTSDSGESVRWSLPAAASQ